VLKCSGQKKEHKDKIKEDKIEERREGRKWEG
jgi:hypothetical protein